MSSTKGATGSGMIKYLVLVLIGGIAVIPTIATVNTSGWSTTNTTLFALVSTFVIIGLVVGASKMAK